MPKNTTMTDIEKKEGWRERFKQKFCWQDTDGKWFLNADPFTVLNVLDFIATERQNARAEGQQEERARVKDLILKNTYRGLYKGYDDNGKLVVIGDLMAPFIVTDGIYDALTPHSSQS